MAGPVTSIAMEDVT